LTPALGLLTGATVWGLIWYPFRSLEHAGIPGDLAVTLTYAIALFSALVLFRHRLAWHQVSMPLAAIGITAGWANIGFTYAVIYGDVMRVVLLFYLAPVWTVLFAQAMLGEKAGTAGYGVVALALGGALLMLWDPRIKFPLPQSIAEWIGLFSGMMFALSNVLSRRYASVDLGARVVAIFAGGVAVGCCSVVLLWPGSAVWSAVAGNAGLLALIGLVMFSANIAIQHGLANISANRAIVLCLFELVVTALSAWLLAGDTLTFRESCGGAMIIVAGLLSERLGARLAATGDHRD